MRAASRMMSTADAGSGADRAEGGKLWGGRFRGQEQVWYLARVQGSDTDIDLEAHDPPEFCDWKWVEAEQLPDLIVPFKKRVYRAVVEAFRELV